MRNYGQRILLLPHLGMTYGMASITATVVIQIISAPRKAGAISCNKREV